MLEAVLDESGSYPVTRVMAVGGYIAEHAEWAQLEIEWSAVLKAAGVTGGFHMADFESGYGRLAEGTSKELRLLRLHPS